MIKPFLLYLCLGIIIGILKYTEIISDKKKFIKLFHLDENSYKFFLFLSVFFSIILWPVVLFKKIYRVFL